MAIAVRPGSLRSPYTYLMVVAIMNRINRVFEEGNVPPGRGVPYAPLAWDPLFVPQPIELAAAPLQFPGPPDFAAEPIYLKDCRELPRTFNELRTAFGVLREEVRSES